MQSIKNRKFLSISIFLVSFFLPNPVVAQQEIVAKAIEFSGTTKLKNAEASFTFRDHSYKYRRNKGRFEYTRIGNKIEGTEIRDVYTNEGLNRYVDDTMVTLNEKRKKAFTNSVNSVIYFAFLPLWLKENRKSRARSTIKYGSLSSKRVAAMILRMYFYIGSMSRITAWITLHINISLAKAECDSAKLITNVRSMGLFYRTIETCNLKSKEVLTLNILTKPLMMVNWKNYRLLN